ncbi:divalent-cation tolerance protein CutA [Desulfogranum japonicum]|uniref:divalent-cation tolerance protein CutA n=1 Tax=Desulfogranum japonicum TaxID=231447 RepID=UPI00042A044F|nr:divalent-cation tolerance protein CutA [Desulfogranum japonicum]
MSRPYIQVHTTVSTSKDAKKIAEAVLSSRLAACVQIVPCLSRYHWQGTIEETQEHLCLMKTRSELFDRLKNRLCEVHPYEVPEIIATEITDGHEPYFQWLNQEVNRQDD